MYAAWFNIGVLFGHEDDNGNAIIAYRNALAVRPDLYGAAINLGLLLETAGHPDQALATWQHATQPDVARVALEIQQGRLLEKLGRFEEAERVSCLRTFLSRFSWMTVAPLKHKPRPA
jgi:tetratricopeptide (TPR) repeat protein